MKRRVIFTVCICLMLSLLACSNQENMEKHADSQTEAVSEESSLPAEQESRGETPVSSQNSNLPDISEQSLLDNTSDASVAESEPESESEENAESDKSTLFPYIPAAFNPTEVYPSLYEYDGSFDRLKNNQKIGNASFYLDESLFTPVATEYDHFLRFDSILDSKIGPYRITALAEYIESLNLIVLNKDDTLNQVMTLNYALDQFLSANPAETFTLFSESINGRYIPAAMFVGDTYIGFIYFFSDEQYVYSVQLLSFDSSYADQQLIVMSDLINSISVL